jgi:hypothetical protein
MQTEGHTQEHRNIEVGAGHAEHAVGLQHGTALRRHAERRGCSEQLLHLRDCGVCCSQDRLHAALVCETTGTARREPCEVQSRPDVSLLRTGLGGCCSHTRNRSSKFTGFVCQRGIKGTHAIKQDCKAC